MNRKDAASARIRSSWDRAINRVTGQRPLKPNAAKQAGSVWDHAIAKVTGARPAKGREKG